MKKLVLLLSILIGLSACSSLELQTVTTSEEETQRILALGLSYEENLIEASKFSDPHMVKVVSLQLTNAKDEKIQYEIDLLESEKVANNVILSLSGTNFSGPIISKSESTVLNMNPDLLNYNLEGLKNLTSGIVNHKLQLSLIYNSNKKRNYISANLCDKWSRCDDNSIEINNISTNASNCSSSSCDYKEIVEINLSDEFLRNYIKKGFTIRINSKKNSNKVIISRAYLMGYLQVAQ
ncbi:MAG: hypothetical protein HON34_04320 [Pelagibacteraceae bacterium]|nr:hypothetical protein [Pelagibacteraceae bacterium]